MQNQRSSPLIEDALEVLMGRFWCCQPGCYSISVPPSVVHIGNANSRMNNNNRGNNCVSPCDFTENVKSTEIKHLSLSPTESKHRQYHAEKYLRGFQLISSHLRSCKRLALLAPINIVRLLVHLRLGNLGEFYSRSNFNSDKEFESPSSFHTTEIISNTPLPGDFFPFVSLR